MRPTNHQLRVLAAAAALALILTACSSGNGGTESSSAGASPTTAATSSAPASPTASGGGGGNATTIDQANFSFSPSTFSVKSGSTITVDNTTPSTAHTFTIQGSNVDVTLEGGQSQDVTIDLPPGTYTFICRFHQSLGMKGTLTVS